MQKIKLNTFFITLLIAINLTTSNINAAMGPNISTDYKTMFANLLRQGATAMQNAFSYIASSVSSAFKTNPSSSLIKTIPSQQPSLSSPAPWVILAGAILAGGTIAFKTGALKKFLNYVNPPTSLKEKPFDFANLPPEIQQKIILTLSTYPYMQNLQDAAKAINSLSQVDKNLNEFINEPKFCLQLIKSLAQQFNVTDEEAAKTLQTKGAKERLTLQQSLKTLCEEPISSSDFQPASNALPFRTIRQQQFMDLKEQGADFNFTYQFPFPRYAKKEFIFTPLTIALRSNNSFLTKTLKKNGSNINQVLPHGDTALTFLTEQVENLNELSSNNAETIKIMYIDPLKNLLENGANPDIPNAQGKSARETILKINDSSLTQLLKNPNPK